MATLNKVVRVPLAGGLIGLMLTSPSRALNSTIDRYNKEGWTVKYFQTHRTTNALVFLAQLVVLCLTLFLWTFGAGYLVLLEKEMD